MAKRSAARDLNHDNWNQEEEPEEIGIFKKADETVLQTRVIKQAKRRVQAAKVGANPFSGFSGFGNANNSPTNNSPTNNSPFSFLMQNIQTAQKLPEESASKSKDVDTKSSNKLFFINSSQSKSNAVSPSTNEKGKSPMSPEFKPFENIFKTSPTSKESEKKSQNLETLKDLNLSCSSWIAEHLQKNPYCILTPIFKDYEKHLAKLDLDSEVGKNKANVSSAGISTSNGSPKTFKPVTISIDPPQQEKTDKPTEVKADGISQIPTFSFKPQVSAPAVSSTFASVFSSSPSTFTFGNVKPPDADPAPKNDDESDEPPKNEFVPVVEDDSIFDIRCKVFVKKDGGYVSKGVGTLFIKPIKDTKKYQLIVRGDTSLGNILLNVLLTSSIPIQKTGTNNVMIVCLPTHDATPPPVPVLIRVKTSEDCDKVIKKLEECKGS